MTTADANAVKVYTVNGAASGSSSALPDWLTRKRVAKKGKRAVREHYEGTINLLQEFEFPEASNKIKTTRDGHHAIATGVYKPQMRCYDLDQLTLKFERHTDAENVDFVILSDDWTKMLLLQADRSVELHTQGGFHYRTRIPRAGRSIAYHYSSCDALIGGSSSEVYRLNLDQGRFLNPLALGSDGEDVTGVNVIDVNPAHQLLAFGIEENGSVQFWDPRSRSRVGVLRLPRNQLVTPGSLLPLLPGVDDGESRGVSVTAMSSRADGLSYAIGTSTGHTLLYDIRSSRHFAMKDLGYGLPVKNVSWIEGGNRMAGDGLVLSADRKVIKIWDRNNPEANFVSVTPAYDINDVHHLPGSGMLMLANEGIEMTSYYIPSLGPAPRWCNFLDNITEELEDQTARSAYEDYKFVERGELAKLGLDTLVGTPALRPYMHGYFVSLKLYDAARTIARPFEYEEHKAKQVQAKMDKLAETRIRSRPGAPAPKVNKILAERLRKEEERRLRHEERKREKKEAQEIPEKEKEGAKEDEEGEEAPEKQTVLRDPRFAALFENEEFEVDENSREFALLNPSRAAQAQTQTQTGAKRAKTAVEEEEEESDRASSSFGSHSSNSEDEDSDEEQDSSEAGDLDTYNPRARPSVPASTPSAATRRTGKQPRMVAAAPRVEGRNNSNRNSLGKDASFGQRARPNANSRLSSKNKNDSKASSHGITGEQEFTWVPSNKGDIDPEDMLVPGGRGTQKKPKRKGVETFGAGLERGAIGTEDAEKRELPESERHGRSHRRKGIRSGSKNAFRGL